MKVSRLCRVLLATSILSFSCSHEQDGSAENTVSVSGRAPKTNHRPAGASPGAHHAAGTVQASEPDPMATRANLIRLADAFENPEGAVPGSGVDDRNLPSRRDRLEGDYGRTTKDGNKIIDPIVLRKIREVLFYTQAKEFEWYVKRSFPTPDQYRKFWVPASPELRDVKTRIDFLVAHKRHIASERQIGPRDVPIAKKQIQFLIDRYALLYPRVPVRTPSDAMNLIAAMRHQTARSNDWQFGKPFQKLFAYGNIGFTLRLGSVACLPNNDIYAETDEAWIWVDHDQDDIAIGANLLTYSVPYILKNNADGLRIFASATPTANSPRQAKPPERSLTAGN